MQGMDGTGGFYEDDEPVEKVLHAFDQGEKGKTARPTLGWNRYLHISGLEVRKVLQPTHNETAGGG